MAPPPTATHHRKPQFFSDSNHKSITTSQTNSYSQCCTLFLFKLTVLSALLLLLALPLFPSRPPESSTLLNHLLELLHLLFIGIAVSYGLFSRKSLHIPISDETLSHPHSSLSDLSMMFHLSPDASHYNASSSSTTKPDGFQDPCGYAETNVIQAWNSQYNQTQSVVVVANGYKSLGLPVRSLKSTVSDLHGNGLSSDSKRSPPSSYKSSSDQTRSRVLGDLGHAHLDSDRALPSPISWRSRSGRMEVTEKARNNGPRGRPLSVDETQFESFRARPLHLQSKASSFSPATANATISSSASSKQHLSPLSNSVSPELPTSKMEDIRYKEIKTDNFVARPAHSGSVSFEFTDSKMEDLRYRKMEMIEEMDNVNGHAHFKPPSIDETECESPKSESFGSDASISSNAGSSYSSSSNHSPLHSSERRMGMREEPSDFVRSSRIKPLSVDETQFESLHSRPFKSKASYSSRTRLKPSPPSYQSPSHSSPSEYSPGSRIGMLENKKSFHRSSPPTMSMDGEAALDRMNSKKCSNESLSEKDTGREFDDAVDSSGSKKELQLGSLKQERKSAALGKAPSRGKSVRTIRSSSKTAEARSSRDAFRNRTDDGKFNEDEALERGEARTKARGCDNPPISRRKHNRSNHYPVPNQTMSRSQNREKHKAAWKNYGVECEEDLESEDGNFPGCSEEEIEEELVASAKSIVRAECDEVDKKADEFIAKFREQIRLQKIASIELSGELNITDNYFR